MHLPRGYLKQAYEAIRAKGGVCIMDEVSLHTLVYVVSTLYVYILWSCVNTTHTSLYYHLAMFTFYHYSMYSTLARMCILQVQTGFGRLGSHYWAFEDSDVEPDIGRCVL